MFGLVAPLALCIAALRHFFVTGVVSNARFKGFVAKFIQMKKKPENIANDGFWPLFNPILRILFPVRGLKSYLTVLQVVTAVSARFLRSALGGDCLSINFLISSGLNSRLRTSALQVQCSLAILAATF